MAHLGIDYGRGVTNRDMANGIRYGVIHHGEVGQAWYDSAEEDYGEPHCPLCSSDDVSDDVPSEYEYHCVGCGFGFDSNEAHGDEPIAFTVDGGEYVATQDSNDCDIFVIKAPYYTYAPFCSPCAPGAGYLGSADGRDETSGVKTYCFGHDWFEGGHAPYRVFRVDDNTEVFPNESV